MARADRDGGKVYHRLAPAYEILASAERIRTEVDSLETHLRAIGATRLLDAGCAVGLHSQELARRGFQVTGIDLSEEMIREGRQRALALGVDVRFDVMDLEGVGALGAGRFDAVLCLGNTMAYAHTATRRRAALRAFSRVLRPGGILVLQLRDLSSIRRTGHIFPTRSLRRDGEEWILLRRQEPIGGKMRFTSTLLYRGGDLDPWETHMSESLLEILPVSEWKALVSNAGFRRVRFASDLRGTPRRARGAADLIIFARR